VTLEERAFVSTTREEELVPVATWPNDIIEGLAVTNSLSAPAPPTTRSSVVFDASLENLIVPPVHPLAVGVKLTLRSTLCPAAKTSGRFKLDGVNDGVNSELLTDIPETVTLVSPLFVMATSKVVVLPTVTAPNRRFDGIHVSWGVAAATLNGAMAKSAIATPIVKRQTVRTARG